MIEPRVDFGVKVLLGMGGVVFLSLFLEKVLILGNFILKLLIDIGFLNDNMIDVDIRLKLVVLNEPFDFELTCSNKLIIGLFPIVIEIRIVLRGG